MRYLKDRVGNATNNRKCEKTSQCKEITSCLIPDLLNNVYIGPDTDPVF